MRPQRYKEAVSIESMEAILGEELETEPDGEEILCIGPDGEWNTFQCMESEIPEGYRPRKKFVYRKDEKGNEWFEIELRKGEEWVSEEVGIFGHDLKPHRKKGRRL